jgi:hypothetical protein
VPVELEDTAIVPGFLTARLDTSSWQAQVDPRGEAWDKPREMRFIAVLKSIRSHAATALIGSCRRLVSGILSERSLVLFPARAEGALDEMLAKTPGAAANFPCYRVLREVLPRLPALAAALAGHDSLPHELVESVVYLLTPYGRDDRQESVTPIGPLLPGGQDLSHRQRRRRPFGAVHLRAGALRCRCRAQSGDSRQKYNSVTWEGWAQGLCKDSTVADTISLLATELSIVRRILATGKAQFANGLLNHAANLSSYFSRFTSGLILCLWSSALSTQAAHSF